MVLINGVKYACERCIRGHRVTTCTHTDQPLTKIKPKGRPASQCQHCRDQRKLKSLHINCTCGKKTNHSSNCYKNPNGCTCYQNHKMKALDKSKKKDSKLISKDPKDGKEFSPELEGKSHHKSKRNVAVDAAGVSFGVPDDKLDFSSDLFEMLNTRNDDISVDFPEMKQSLDFPLFPLIGTQSFDNENMPLSSIPDSVESSVAPEPISQPAADPINSDEFSDFKEFSELQELNGNDSADSKSTPGSISNGNTGKFISSKGDTSSFATSSNMSGNNLASSGDSGIPVADPSLDAYFSDQATNNSSAPNSTSFTRSHSFKNRPSSVLSLNSTVSNESKPDNRFDSKLDIIDSKLESSAYPPSSNSNNHSYSNLNLNITGHLANPKSNMANQKFPFGNIMESNEVYVSDEDIQQSFWNENQELAYR